MPADTTFPRITSSISSFVSFACFIAPLIATAPREVAWTSDREPMSEPIGVRFAATMTTFLRVKCFLKVFCIRLYVFVD